MKLIFKKDVMMAPETGIHWTFHAGEGYYCKEEEFSFVVFIKERGEWLPIEAPKALLGEYFYILNDFGERIENLSN